MHMHPIIRRTNSPITRYLFDSFFDDDWGHSPIFNGFTDRSEPKTNVSTSDNDYRIDVIIPGLDREDIDINVTDDILKISHQTKENANDIISYRSFSRSWTLPQNVTVEEIAAEYKQGILSIVVPKNAASTPVTHQIDIK